MQHRDLQVFSTACEDIYAPGLALENFVTRGFAMLRAIVACEFIACGVLNRADRKLTIGLDCEHAGFAKAIPMFGRLMSRYPLYDFNPATHGGRPYCRRQFFSERQFRDSAMYTEVYRPLGIDNHCAVHVPAGPNEVLYYGIERDRGPDFSEDELLLLEFAQAHLANAHALARTQAAAIDDIVQPQLLVRAGLTPREAEALFWMSHGKSNAEIALILGLRTSTVKDYAAAIFNKSGTGNRHAAIRWAQRTCLQLRNTRGVPQGFIDVPAPIYRSTPV